MKRQPVIVAITQPNWFRVANAEKYRKALEYYADVEQWRQVMLRSEAGKKAKRYMKDLFDITIWRCANPARPLSSQEGQDYDVNHLNDMLKAYCPDIVIAFGATAQNGIDFVFKGPFKTKKPMPFNLVKCDDIMPLPNVDFGMINMCREVRDLIEKL